ncbi:MAG: hypothetical protein ACK5RV_09575 [Flavobacterium sp.]|jgi:hypothetical protein|uniref:hypothetical protein n=1 Tax=Flavobacterium sp. TaxID=239 RepID=UPI0022C87310|nr:hypothetical protein [Flavobacterium sp.]MCZ8168933.1 hypothetical protein [Flavobacterium sp.]MCZ8297503.1 hypothetical protein [Flavobacterium sp.]
MIELLRLAFGLVVLALLWYFFRTIARSVDNAARFDKTQKEILERLDQIQRDLDEVKKGNA